MLIQHKKDAINLIYSSVIKYDTIKIEPELIWRLISYETANDPGFESL